MSVMTQNWKRKHRTRRVTRWITLSAWAALLVAAAGLSAGRLQAQTASDIQILNRIYDSTNTALKINVVANGDAGGEPRTSPTSPSFSIAPTTRPTEH